MVECIFEIHCIPNVTKVTLIQLSDSASSPKTYTLSFRGCRLALDLLAPVVQHIQPDSRFPKLPYSLSRSGYYLFFVFKHTEENIRETK